MTEIADRTSTTTSSSGTAPRKAPERRGDRLTRRETTVIGVLLVSTFVVILNETIMSVAIPVLIDDLHITASTGQWLSTAFVLTLAVVIPVSGFLIQRLTTKTLFLVALGSFAAGTLLAALAPGFEVLLLARIIQGIGAAVITPLLFTTVIDLVPEHRRGAMMGNISVVISVAPALGPTVSGVVLNFLDWRWIFWLVLPFAVVALVVGGRMITNIGETRRVPIDWLSIPLAALGFGGLVYGLNAVGANATNGGGSSAQIVFPLVIGALGLAAFLLRQWRLQREDRALLDLRAFTSRVFTASVVAGGLAFLGLLGSAILLPIYLQQVLGLTALQTGLLVLPGGLLMGLLGPIVGRIYDRTGPRALLFPGMAIAAAALVELGFVTDTTPAWYVLIGHLVLSFGLACVLPSLFTAGLSAVPAPYSSYGSAIFATVQQVGGAAGTALVITLLAVGSTAARANGASAGAAEAAGSRLAFLVAAGVFVVAFGLSAMIKRVGDGSEVPAPH
jgi:DHA2 family lincomycin resistance protein-like MFS transporter